MTTTRRPYQFPSIRKRLKAQEGALEKLAHANVIMGQALAKIEAALAPLEKAATEEPGLWSDPQRVAPPVAESLSLARAGLLASECAIHGEVEGVDVTLSKKETTEQPKPEVTE